MSDVKAYYKALREAQGNLIAHGVGNAAHDQHESFVRLAATYCFDRQC
ncbi:hypothetical protein G3576_30235 [Roseomonas stagni]|uniref:Uncharacterized protein n=1 Tax=Falsiroseomonas algicola TaxID=2716930 RepID=A0A6M1LVY4_9PROT|nr:hypothetical protein [Falsiroseomonas algicola]NGM24307.1 hypothetical protein [Falsiroseomonas algicola]